MSDYVTNGKGQNTMGKKLQPKLRFRGFTDAWEPRKLGNIMDSYSGGTPAANNSSYYGGEIPFIRSAEIDDDSTALFLTQSGLSASSAKWVKKGDVLYALYGANSGNASFAKLDGVINQAVLAIKPKEGFYNAFLMYWLQKNKRVITATFLQGGQGNLSGSIVKKLSIHTPRIEEQERIGILLIKIDELIAAEKRKLQLIEMKKRLLLQRILNGKMRFMGFCDSWIQLKLDDAICVCSGKDYKHLSKGNIPVYGTGGYITSVSKALSNRDAIGIGRKGTIDKPYVLRAPFWTVDTLFYALPRNGYDLNFLFAVFQNINWKSKNESTGLPSLSKKNIENTSIITPSIDEQCRIGELFSLFDSILDETNQKIRLLEKKRKALLRDMFV